MFRPGSIFYDEHGQPPAKTPPSTLLAPDSVPLVSLVSPPPSPSRNSIFDQPWSTPARPNITSLRATTSNQTNASLSSLSSLSATRPNNSTTPAASIAPDNEYSPSKSKSKSKSNGNYSAKILLHNNNSNTSLSGTNQTISISMEEPSETTIGM
ncbi:hypothetical protein BC939DRAFT_477155 [Gamsiella multidivaricata]|uniref:uncharacterized protein n=1 Tax=Gamsiella multidivaricata TaxID=101098 RepID=UPI00221F3557|nr:uncharacterized protein BC939DRAFT_477155 [Gamsiella multidivaricata]KAI7823619.1 hypothetical protein BC939DRAFT_477155 [Gamsiella multidivaricata]